MLLDDKPLKFKNAKKVITSEKYIVLLTGKSAIILNKEFEILHKESNLTYVYNGTISPDQKKLLLVSNANVFYIFDLTDFSLEKKVICRHEYCGNLEGCGLWCLDSRHILIPVQHFEKSISHIRCYDIFNGYSYTEYELNNAYFIISCCASPDNKSFYFAAYKFSFDNSELYLIKIENEQISYIPLTKIEDVVMEIKFINNLNAISIMGQDNIHFVDSNDFAIMNFEEITQLYSKNYFSNTICKIISSNYNPYVFFVSLNAVYIIETNTKNIIYSKNFTDDIWDIVEISKDAFAVCFVNSAHIIKFN